jgi:hypothetical protein
MKQNENILPTCKEYLAKLIKLDLNFYEVSLILLITI